MTWRAFFLAASFGTVAVADDLLTAAPPCVAPADLPAGSGDADLDSRREASSGIPPADLARSRPVDLDVPLYLPPSGIGGSATKAPSTNDLVQTGTPIGGVAIRGGKAVSVQTLGQEQLGDPPASGCAP